MNIQTTLYASFLEKFIKCGEDECWPWVYSVDSNGYGQFGFQYKTYRASIVSYEYFKGHTNDLFVCHTCDNKICVNPKHLILGTNKENIQDYFITKKNLPKRSSVETHIRAVYMLKNGVPVPEISKELGISKNSLYNMILKRKKCGQ